MTSRDKFKFQTFYIIVDKLVTETEKRRSVYSDFNEKFSFLTDLKLNIIDKAKKAENLVDAYPSDLEAAFVDEFVLFSQLGYIEVENSSISVTNILQHLIADNLVNSFPKVNIAFRLYLSISGTSCEGERTFSVLKRIKNCQRSTILQAKVSFISLLSIESEVLREVNVQKIIADIANRKCRKVLICAVSEY